MNNEILPVTWGRRKNGSAWISIGSIEQGPHAACDVELPDWALAALSAQAAEIGSLRLEVEGLRNQRDSAQRSSMEAKDQLAAQAAELARLRDDAKLLDLLDIVIDGKELIEFRAATEMQQIAPRRQAMRPNGKVALFSIATQHIVADDARDALRKLSAALAQIREARDKPLSP